MPGKGFYGIADDSIQKRLYVSNNKDIYTIDPESGHAAEVLSFGFAAAARELTFDSGKNRLLLGTEGLDGQKDMNGLNEVDLHTREVRFIGAYKGTHSAKTFNNLRAIEYDPRTNRLLGVDEGTDDEYLVQIDTASAAANLPVKLVPKYSFGGIAFVIHK